MRRCKVGILSILASLTVIPVVRGQGFVPESFFSRAAQLRVDARETLQTDSLKDVDLERVKAAMPGFEYNDSLPFMSLYPLIYSGPVYDNPAEYRFDSTLCATPVRGTSSFLKALTETPAWLREAALRWHTARLIQQQMMTGPQHTIDYFAWQLPEPPQLAPITEAPVIPASRNIPAALPSMTEAPQQTGIKRHWLHVANFSLQFSQAYVSPNWYQGGDNSLTILGNFLWNVKLNQVYHPNLLLESNLQYKLGLYSTPNDKMHKYAISEDLLQYNLTGGVKAFRHWYYSFSMLFKTQMLNNYSSDSWDRKASFMSPGELNLGFGMTYSNANKKRGIQLQVSIAPLSYNLRTCIDSRVNPTLFNIKEGRKSRSEFGSNGELVMTWTLAPNISWKQRLYLFSDYHYFTGDWEHTFNFAINRFLSTQVYVHGRFDSSAPGSEKGWKKWMLKEILSFGFAYQFTTTPPKK